MKPTKPSYEKRMDQSEPAWFIWSNVDGMWIAPGGKLTYYATEALVVDLAEARRHYAPGSSRGRRETEPFPASAVASTYAATVREAENALYDAHRQLALVEARAAALVQPGTIQ